MLLGTISQLDVDAYMDEFLMLEYTVYLANIELQHMNNPTWIKGPQRNISIFFVCGHESKV